MSLPARVPFDPERLFREQALLETPRLLLRPIILADAPDLLEVYSDPEVGQFNAWMPLQSVAEAEDKIRTFQAQYEQKQRIRWGLVLRETGKLLGDFGFMNLDARGHLGEIGFNLARAHWRKGYMREAALAVIGYGFREVGLNRVEGYVMPENVGSVGLLLRLGMQKEGRLRETGFIKGKYVDLDLYALLWRDWIRLGMQD